MRTLLTTAAIAALIALGLDSAAWGQQNRNAGTGAATGGGALGGASAAQGLGASILSSEVSPIEQRVSLEPGQFIGADVEDARNVMERTGRRVDAGQTRRGGASPFGSSQFNRTFQALSSLYGSGFGTGRRSSEIRARVVARIDVNRAPASELSSQLAQRMEKSSWVKTESPMQVTIEKGTATLRGVVASDHHRRLAERMARLEPGVRRVDNQLTVAASTAPAATEPTLQ